MELGGEGWEGRTGRGGAGRVGLGVGVGRWVREGGATRGLREWSWENVIRWVWLEEWGREGWLGGMAGRGMVGWESGLGEGEGRVWVGGWCWEGGAGREDCI